MNKKCLDAQINNWAKDKHYICISYVLFWSDQRFDCISWSVYLLILGFLQACRLGLYEFTVQISPFWSFLWIYMIFQSLTAQLSSKQTDLSQNWVDSLIWWIDLILFSFSFFLVSYGVPLKGFELKNQALTHVLSLLNKSSNNCQGHFYLVQ